MAGLCRLVVAGILSFRLWQHSANLIRCRIVSDIAMGRAGDGHYDLRDHEDEHGASLFARLDIGLREIVAFE